MKIFYMNQEEISNKILVEVVDIKEQIKDMATKEDLKLMATKEDLKKVEGQIDFIVAEVVGMKERMETFATKDQMNEKFDLVLGNIDRFVKLHETLDVELASLRHKYNRLEERIVVVERQLQIA